MSAVMAERHGAPPTVQTASKKNRVSRSGKSYRIGNSLRSICTKPTDR